MAAEQMPAESDSVVAARGSMSESGASISNDGKAPDSAKAAPAAESTSQNFRQSASAPITASLTQQFSQSAANKMLGSRAKLQKAPKVLDNFQVEQNGRDFRVVDDDGSTYAGRIEPLTANDTRNYPKEKQAYAAAPAVPAASAKRAAVAEQAPNNEFYFHASGYNASLKKSLVFEGNYIVTATPGKDLNAAAEKNAAQQAARIVGTAKVSGEPPVQVDAVAVPAK
jgi:hypothetical protein